MTLAKANIAFPQIWIGVFLFAFLAMTAARSASEYDSFDRKCAKFAADDHGTSTLGLYDRCIEKELERQTRTLKHKACNSNVCLYRLQYIGSGEFSGENIKLICEIKKDFDYSIPEEAPCKLEQDGGAVNVAHSCGGRDCDWTTPKGIKIYGFVIKYVQDAEPGSHLFVLIEKNHHQ